MVRRPVPLSPRTYTFWPGAWISSPKRSASTASSWPMIPGIGASSRVVANPSVAGSQRQRRVSVARGSGAAPVAGSRTFAMRGRVPQAGFQRGLLCRSARSGEHRGPAPGLEQRRLRRKGLFLGMFSGCSWACPAMRVSGSMSVGSSRRSWRFEREATDADGVRVGVGAPARGRDGVIVGRVEATNRAAGAGWCVRSATDRRESGARSGRGPSVDVDGRERGGLPPEPPREPPRSEHDHDAEGRGDGGERDGHWRVLSRGPHGRVT